MTDHIAGTGKMAPLRIQRRRTKGWRMPANTVSVSRPGRWGNPFTVGIHAESKVDAVSLFASWLEDAAAYAPTLRPATLLAPLRGKHLACWCRLCPTHASGKPLGVQCDTCEPCHADLLLECANA